MLCNTIIAMTLTTSLVTADPSEDQRKRIFFTYSGLYNESGKLADEKFGVNSSINATTAQIQAKARVAREWGAFADQEYKRLRNSLLQQYEITREQLDAIATEGSRNKWPIPPLR